MTIPPPTTSPSDPTLGVPTPDDIRAAIDAADDRARLLRRLLRISLRLHHPVAGSSVRPTTSRRRKEAVGV